MALTFEVTHLTSLLYVHVRACARVRMCVPNEISGTYYIFKVKTHCFVSLCGITPIKRLLSAEVFPERLGKQDH